MEKVTQPRGLRLLWTAAALVVVIVGLRHAEELLVPLVIAAFLAALTAPLVIWLSKHRIPPLLSVPLLVLIVLGVLLGFVGLLVGTGRAFVAAFPRYQERLDQLFSDASVWLRQHGVDLDWDLLYGSVKPESAVKILDATLTGLTNAVSYTMLVIFTMVFMLFEVTALPRKLRAAMGDPEADLRQFKNIATEIKHYLAIKTYVSLATGTVVWLMLSVLGVDYALLWGVLAFLFNYIPTIGSIIAAIPAVLLALVQHGVGVCVIVLGGYVIINLAVGSLIEPHLMGRRLGLSTLVVFLSLVFWGWLWGVPGMLLSVPLTMIVKIAMEHDESWRWCAVLMGQAPRGAATHGPPASPRSRRSAVAAGGPSGPGAPSAGSEPPAGDSV